MRPAGPDYLVRVSETVLPLTGERTLPGIASENYWYRRHEVAYSYLRGRLAGRRLLEVGAGEGYGAAMLAPRFQHTLALDYDWAAIAHLHRRYPGLAAARANLAALPVRSGAIDAVVSLQVLEHVWFPDQFLTECRRVLGRGGTLVLSTPNRLTFSPGLDRGQKPRNPFHIREFDAEELVELLQGNGFVVTRVRGVHSARPDHDELVAAQLRAQPADWSPALIRAVAEVSLADFTVTGDRISTSLDLIVEAQPA